MKKFETIFGEADAVVTDITYGSGKTTRTVLFAKDVQPGDPMWPLVKETDGATSETE